MEVPKNNDLTLTQPMTPPWRNSPIPQFIREEFKRRADYGVVYPSEQRNNATKYSKDYRGPQTSWIRLYSNAKVTHNTNSIGNGFVMTHGSTGFYNSYGINNNNTQQNSPKEQTIGYDRNGKPHILLSDKILQRHRPPPTVSSIEVHIKRDIYRMATIQWKCFSIDQLEYLLPYFFTPYVTLILEWGWNNFDNDSLVQLDQDGIFVSSHSKSKFSLNYATNTGEIIQVDGKTPIGNGVFSAFSVPQLFEQYTKNSS